MLEKEPMEHFKRAVEFFDSGRITKAEATEALQLEFQLFAEGRWSEFTGDRAAASQIELLISTATYHNYNQKYLLVSCTSH